MTTWKTINGYPNYSVSNEGQVRNNKTMKVLSPALDSNGYSFVILYKDGEKWHGYLHRLVATAFIPNLYNLPEVNHKNGNKTNNHEKNLEWCTHAENVNHSLRLLAQVRRVGGKKAVLCVETGEIFPSIASAAKAVGRSSTAIRKCVYGWTKTCAGLHWRYCYDYENGSDSRGEGYDLWLCKSRWEEYFGVPEEQGLV